MATERLILHHYLKITMHSLSSNKVSSIDFQSIVCVEGRGFIVGSAIAFNLKKGLVPVRVPGKLKRDIHSIEYVDYSGKSKSLDTQTDAISEKQKVVLVDDWVETGATLRAVIRLVERVGAEIVGIVVFMDDSSQETKEELAKYNYMYLEIDMKKHEDF